MNCFWGYLGQKISTCVKNLDYNFNFTPSVSCEYTILAIFSKCKN